MPAMLFLCACAAALYMLRGVVFFFVYLAIGHSAIETTSLIGQATVNNVATAVGGSAPYVLPPRSHGEVMERVKLGPVTTQTEQREFDNRAVYVFNAQGTITNSSPWTFGRVAVKCYFQTHDMDNEQQVTDHTDIDIKPGETVTFTASVKTKSLYDLSGIASAQCKGVPVT